MSLIEDSLKRYKKYKDDPISKVLQDIKNGDIKCGTGLKYLDRKIRSIGKEEDYSNLNWGK